MIYRLLDVPWVYRLAQVVLAPGQHRLLTRIFRETAHEFPAARRILDVGCGPSSWLWRVGTRPIGLDFSVSYVHHYVRSGGAAIAATASAIPFADSIFDQSWCFGLLHHLSDDDARRTLEEMRRVTRSGGPMVVMDAVLPRSPWRRPVAYALRKLDRGGCVRSEAHHRTLLGEGWTIERALMAYNGLEVTIAIRTAS
jgi:ubiquinone/menaquinone biosynthesis C-methylase UbiE